MPTVIVPKAGPAPATERPGHPSELNVRVQQELPPRKIILIPQAPENSQQEPPKAAKVISVQAKPTAAAGRGVVVENFKPPQLVPAPERAPAKVMKASIPQIIHSQPPILPSATIPEPMRKGGTVADSRENIRLPRKLPASMTDSPLVLGPASDLLEATKVAATSAGSTRPEAQAPTGVIILPGGSEKGFTAKTQPYLEKWLTDYIRTACGGLVEGLEITLNSGNRLQVHFRVKNDADVESIGQKIMDLPELAPYQVSLDLTVSP
jgi:hypothetical protein